MTTNTNTNERIANALRELVAYCEEAVRANILDREELEENGLIREARAALAVYEGEAADEGTKQQYVALDPDGDQPIWGLGATAEAAMDDANQYTETRDGLLALPCSAALAELVARDGGDVAWEVVGEGRFRRVVTFEEAEAATEVQS